MIYILNFKTYLKSLREHFSLITKLKKIKTRHELWLALNPYFYLSLYRKIKSSKIKVGLQNLGFVSSKPQTGEIISDFEGINSVYFVLLGHSERYRTGEDLEVIRKKIETLQNLNFKLVIFFSENSYNPKEKFSSLKNRLAKNLNFLLEPLTKNNYSKIYLVYEPWWAISTEGGKIPSSQFLKDFLKWYKQNYSFPILYGGSYNFELAKVYFYLKFDGYVLGKASTDAKEVKKILSLEVRFE